MDELLEIPEFLRRVETPESKARLKRITARYRTRKIKNPPKRITKAMRSWLGGIFGAKVVTR